MKFKFLRTLVLFFAAFGALHLSVGHDDLREFDAAYIQQEMLKRSAESIAAQRDQQAVYFSCYAASESRCFPISAAVIPSPTLSAFSTCILRC